MQVMNYNTPKKQPQFGMAFIKPDPVAMSNLTDYLTRKKSMNATFEGLRLLITEQSMNRHFNIEYLSNKNSFKVSPVSDEAKKLVNNQEKLFEASKDKPRIEELKEAWHYKSSILAKNGYSRWEILKFRIKTLYDLVSETFSLVADPKKELPKNLQEAAAYADSNADKIEQHLYNSKRISSLFIDETKVKKSK